MIENCLDMSAAYEAYNIIAKAYNEIQEEYEDEIEYRELRKASRGRVVGGGFGFGGAIKGMAMAGATRAKPVSPSLKTHFHLFLPKKSTLVHILGTRHARKVIKAHAILINTNPIQNR